MGENKKKLSARLEKHRMILSCEECGCQNVKVILNGPEEMIDLECHDCGVSFTALEKK